MTTTIDIEANELNYRLFKSLKSMFKGQKIRLTVDATSDETDYLNKSEANRLMLEKSIAQLRQGNVVNVSIKDLKWGLSLLQMKHLNNSMNGEMWIRKSKIKSSKLIDEIQRNPFDGIGKPEPLKHNYKGFWSRKINDEHRLVYEITDSHLNIIACKYHY